jgi:hypothetical protein
VAGRSTEMSDVTFTPVRQFEKEKEEYFNDDSWRFDTPFSLSSRVLKPTRKDENYFRIRQ